MQRALTVDQEVYTNKGAKYIDNPEVANKQIEDPFQNEPASKVHLQTISKMVSELNCDYPVLDEYFVDLGITDKDKMTIGSCSGCDIVLVNDPEVALHHAEITYVNGFEIKVIENAPDLLINNKRVRSAVLRGGDEVVIGRYRMKFFRKIRTIQAPTMPH